MKKMLYLTCLVLLMSGAANAMDNVNVYGKFGADVHSRFNNTSDIDEVGIELGLGFPKKGSTSLGLFLEATKDITPNFELGAGLGYIHRKGKNVTHVAGVSNSATGVSEKTYDSFKAPIYNSMPLYAIAKYNFDVNSEFRPYIKADLGYSFNRMKKSITVESVEYKGGNLIEEDSYKMEFKAKNGLYAGIGVGVEYNNFLAELSYVQTSAKIKATWTEDDFGEEEKVSDTVKYKNKAVRLLFGYKFSY